MAFGSSVTFSTEGEFPDSEHIYSNLAEKPPEADSTLLKRDGCMSFFNCSGC